MGGSGLGRRDLLKGGAAAAGAGLVAATGCVPAPAGGGSGGSGGSGDRPPNIVYIMLDETRFPSVFPSGINGPGEYLRAFMPNVYQHLWQGGVKFGGHYTAGVACSPSRATLATGLYPHQTWLLQTRKGSGGNPPPAPALNRAFPTYGKLLRQAGYQTPHVGKWHLSDSTLPNNPNQLVPGYLEDYGFKHLPLVTPQGTPGPVGDVVGNNGDGIYYDQDIAATAADWLSKRRAGEPPFCLTVSFVNSHDQLFFWGGIYGDEYTATYPNPTNQPGQGPAPAIAWESVPELQNPPSYGYPAVPPNWESSADLVANKPTTQITAKQFTELIWGGITDDRYGPSAYQLARYGLPGQSQYDDYRIATADFSYWQQALDSYTYIQTQLDEQVGKVIAAVPEHVRNNTIFVLTADHGDFVGAHGIPTNKAGTIYEEAFHVPLIVNDQRGTLQGRLTRDTDVLRDELTSSADVLPMLMTMAAGGQSWMTGDLASIYGNRLDLTKLLRSSRARGRRALVMATDEVVPNVFNFNRSPRYILSLRTKKAKLGVYANWRPDSADIEPRSVELEYYDYSTERGRLELDNTPDDPGARRLLRQLRQYYVPNQMQAPLPGSMQTAANDAQAAFIRYVRQLDLLAIAQMREEGIDAYTNHGNGY